MKFEKIMYLSAHNIILFISFLVCVRIEDGAPTRDKKQLGMNKVKEDFLCDEVPTMVLGDILGGAYNPRYMSIEDPTVDTMEKNLKRKVDPHGAFYVDNIIQQLDDRPAWKVGSHLSIAKPTESRPSRSADYIQQWHCPSRISWIDLGPDYFPRYLRSVVCLDENCWFGIFTCRPKSFTVKLLRRKAGICTNVEDIKKIGTVGLPQDLAQLWIWEERAVTFCCDCSVS